MNVTVENVLQVIHLVTQRKAKGSGQVGTPSARSLTLPSDDVCGSPAFSSLFLTWGCVTSVPELEGSAGTAHLAPPELSSPGTELCF